MEEIEAGEMERRKNIPVIDGIVSEEAIESAIDEYNKEIQDLGPVMRLSIEKAINNLESLKKGLEQLEDEDTGYTSDVDLNNIEYEISECMMAIHRGLIDLQAYYKTKREKSL